MGEGSGLRHGSTSAARRPSPFQVVVHADDYSRLVDHLTSVTIVSSPLVPRHNDSDSRHADLPRTSLALSDRLAGDQPGCAVYPRGWPVRALPAFAWSACGAARRQRRRLVGSRHVCLARRSRPPAPPLAGVRPSRCDLYDAQARLPRGRSPQPRPHLQRAVPAQSCCALSALPHDPRCARTSTSPLVECLSPTRVGRPVFWPLQLLTALVWKTRAGGSSARARAFKYEFTDPSEQHVPPLFERSG